MSLLFQFFFFRIVNQFNFIYFMYARAWHITVNQAQMGEKYHFAYQFWNSICLTLLFRFQDNLFLISAITPQKNLLAWCPIQHSHPYTYMLEMNGKCHIGHFYTLLFLGTFTLNVFSVIFALSSSNGFILLIIRC